MDHPLFTALYFCNNPQNSENTFINLATSLKVAYNDLINHITSYKTEKVRGCLKQHNEGFTKVEKFFMLEKLN